MTFIVNNKEKFHTNATVHSIHARNMYHLLKLIAKRLHFKKSIYYAGIRVFNSLPYKQHKSDDWKGTV